MSECLMYFIKDGTTR